MINLRWIVVFSLEISGKWNYIFKKSFGFGLRWMNFGKVRSEIRGKRRCGPEEWNFILNIINYGDYFSF